MSQVEVKRIGDQLQQATAALKLGQGDYRLIRIGANWVFENLADSLVARVAPKQMSADGLNLQLSLAQDLADQAVSVLAPAHPQALSLSGGALASLWPRARPAVGLDGHSFAKLALSFHQAKPPASLPLWSPGLTASQRRDSLAQARSDGLDHDLYRHLKQRFEETLATTEEAYQQFQAEMSVIHGDLYYGNVVTLKDRPLMCDLDNLAFGPKEKDIAMILHTHNRYEVDPSCWQQFTASYPLSYNRKLVNHLLAFQAIGSCLWLASLWKLRPETKSELRNRIDSLDKPQLKWKDI